MFVIHYSGLLGKKKIYIQTQLGHNTSDKCRP